ncbi:MAG: phosphatase PAP2 family protein [Bdellovibrionota bacterium]|nr:MAG: phosphatase PAP2 family protein [Pseudomonadota bacterium]
MKKAVLLVALYVPTAFAQKPSKDKFEETPGDRKTFKETAEIVKEEEPNVASWLWEKQMRPTLEHAGDRTSLFVLLGTAAATSLAHQSDSKFREEYGDNKGMTQANSSIGAVLGSGFPGIALAATQLYIDTENGLQHSRAIAFTALTHISIAATVNRKRPNGKGLSFPSGHTSSSFATAGSMFYAYGPWVGLPAMAVAGYIGLSRAANNAHWLSDIVAGAGLGIFWARASAQVGITKDKDQAQWYPIYQSSEYGPMVGVGFEKNL